MKPYWDSGGAQFSDDRVYRYALWRGWNPSQPYVMFVGLNPSTADELEDDPTIRRCINFCKSWGFGGLYMLNLFALRSTDPKLLKGHAEPVGPDNDRMLMLYAEASAWVVAAWGTQGVLFGRDREVVELLGDSIRCLGLTQDGHPKHPLYLPKDTRSVRWGA